MCKSSRPEVLCKKGVLRNFTKFAGKHLFLRPATLLKKRLWHRCFRVNFMKFLRTTLYIEHLWWLLLYMQRKPSFFEVICIFGILCRSSHQICSMKKAVNSCVGVSFYWSCRPSSAPKQVFSCEYCEIFKNTILKNIGEWLLHIIRINLFSFNDRYSLD